MHGSDDTDAHGPAVMLPAIVDLAAAAALLAALRSRLALDAPCCLDASQVENLMLPGIQVILAAIKSGENVRVINPSASFRRAFDDAALSWTPDGEAESAGERARNEDSQSGRDAGRMRPQPPGERAPAKRILTIDDSKTMRDMLKLTLSGAGYDVLQAVDGQDGLEVLRKERVDVVITDINMPKLDGYGVIRHLRADADYDDTPILVLSTESDQRTKDIGRDAGATGWLVKPFDPDQLVDVVRQVSPPGR